MTCTSTQSIASTQSSKKSLCFLGISIADDPEAFHKSVDDLATLAYATEAVDYTSSTEEGIISKSDLDIEPVQSSTETNLGIWRLIVTPGATTSDPNNLGINQTPIFYPSKPIKSSTPQKLSSTPTNTEYPISTTTPIPIFFGNFVEPITESTRSKGSTRRPKTGSSILASSVKAKDSSKGSTRSKDSTQPKVSSTTAKTPIFFQKLIEKPKKNVETLVFKTTQAPIQLKKMVEKPLEVVTKSPKILKDVKFFEPITEDPLYNWIWTDVDYHEDDLRDPDMTTVETGVMKMLFLLKLDFKNQN